MKITNKKNCIYCGKAYYRNESLLNWLERKYCSRGCMYKCPTLRAARAKGSIGRKMSAASITKRVRSFKASFTAKRREKWARIRRGNKSYLWRGGLTSKEMLFRASYKMRLWRAGVLERDGHKCVLCGSTKQLHADHIKPFSRYPKLRLDPENGRTLCRPCHIESPTYAGRMHSQ